MNCTVTSGGGPILRVEDALSSYASSTVAGELTVTDFSDGEDMVFTAKSYHTYTPQLQLFFFFLRSTKICAALTGCLTDVVNGQTVLRFLHPNFTPTPPTVTIKNPKTIAWTSSKESSTSKILNPS